MSLARVAITGPDGEYHEQRYEHVGNLRAGGDSPRKADASAPGWKWVTQGATLFPARLSFSPGDRDLDLLLESLGVRSSAGQPATVAIGHVASDALTRVRGFIDQGASEIYLRGRGHLGREWQKPALVGSLAHGA